jgi:hypothetical protein
MQAFKAAATLVRRFQTMQEANLTLALPNRQNISVSLLKRPTNAYATRVWRPQTSGLKWCYKNSDAAPARDWEDESVCAINRTDRADSIVQCSRVNQKRFHPQCALLHIL